MNVGIERYEVRTFHGEQSDTFGVMALSVGDIPLGIDAHWHRRQDAEMALRHYQGNLAAHGRTTEQEHRQIESTLRSYHLVPATPHELAQWRRLRAGLAPFRVACDSCGQRYWLGDTHKEVT